MKFLTWAVSCWTVRLRLLTPLEGSASVTSEATTAAALSSLGKRSLQGSMQSRLKFSRTEHLQPAIQQASLSSLQYLSPGPRQSQLLLDQLRCSWSSQSLGKHDCQSRWAIKSSRQTKRASKNHESKSGRSRLRTGVVQKSQSRSVRSRCGIQGKGELHPAVFRGLLAGLLRIRGMPRVHGPKQNLLQLMPLAASGGALAVWLLLSIEVSQKNV